MSYFENIYSKRLNRYGTDFQSRIQGQREREFENKLLKSVYRVDFEYQHEIHAATLEPYKQNNSEALAYFLTRVDLDLPGGTILMLPDKDEKEKPWMVYWLEDIKASGYNRYILIRMSHFLTWEDQNHEKHSSWAYMRGKQANEIVDIRKTEPDGSVYMENQNYNYLIMPRNEHVKKDIYFEIGEGPFREGYRVTGYDMHSTDGVEYVTIDPIYLQEKVPQDSAFPKQNDDVFWLAGGK